MIGIKVLNVLRILLSECANCYEALLLLAEQSLFAQMDNDAFTILSTLLVQIKDCDLQSVRSDPKSITLTYKKPIDMLFVNRATHELLELCTTRFQNVDDETITVTKCNVMLSTTVYKKQYALSIFFETR